MGAMTCPACGKKLQKRSQGQPRFSKKAQSLFGVAGVVGAAWAVAIFLWSPAFLVPRGIGGIALCALFYLGPGIAIGAYASSLPKLRSMKCRGCGWHEERELI